MNDEFMAIKKALAAPFLSVKIYSLSSINVKLLGKTLTVLIILSATSITSI